MADNYALREGTGKLTKFRSVELEGGLHLLIAGLADAEGNLLGSSSAPLPVSVEGGITIGDITLSNVEISNDVGNPVPVAGTVEVTNDVGNALPVKIDQTTPGTTDAVWVKSQGHLATVTTTRPNDTTAYTAGDALGDTNGSAILEFTNMARVSGGNIMITSASMRVDLASIPSGMAGLKLHLYSSSPTAIADNAAWDLVSGDRNKYLGYVQLSTPTDFGSTLFVESNGINKHIQLTGTSLFAIPVLDAGFTPSASTVRQFKIRSIDL